MDSRFRENDGDGGTLDIGMGIKLRNLSANYSTLTGMTCDRSRVSWHLVGTDLPRPLELHPIPLLNHQTPTAHDSPHVGQGLNAIRRVSIEQHQVCHLASLNRPNLVL